MASVSGRWRSAPASPRRSPPPCRRSPAQPGSRPAIVAASVATGDCHALQRRGWWLAGGMGVAPGVGDRRDRARISRPPRVDHGPRYDDETRSDADQHGVGARRQRIGRPCPTRWRGEHDPVASGGICLVACLPGAGHRGCVRSARGESGVCEGMGRHRVLRRASRQRRSCDCCHRRDSRARAFRDGLGARKASVCRGRHTGLRRRACGWWRI